MKTQTITYQQNNTELEGVIAWPESSEKKQPLVMVVHDWSGRNEFADDKAKQLAQLGYIGFAIDMYGKGKLGHNNEEKTALMTPLVEDRRLLRERLFAAFEQTQTIDNVDSNNIAIIGFCFGGLCALDLARSGLDFKAAVSFHGLFNSPDNLPTETIKAKILALHGYDDPMVTPQQVQQFADEMTEAKADWSIHMYGNTMHAFTNPQANDANLGTVYNERAKQRAWIAMQNWFNEVF